MTEFLELSGTEAVAQICAARPGALANAHFRAYLENLAA